MVPCLGRPCVVSRPRQPFWSEHAAPYADAVMADSRVPMGDNHRSAVRKVEQLSLALVHRVDDAGV